MIRMEYGCLIASIAVLFVPMVSLAQSEGQLPSTESTQTHVANGLLPGLTTGQPFLPLIDDVIDNSACDADSAKCGSTVRICQLNRPLLTGESSNASGLEQKPRSTPGGFQFDVFFGDSQLPNGCCSNWETKDPVAACSSRDAYSKQMADLLATTLEGSASNPEAQRRAIETAFQMVTEQAEQASQQRIAKLEIEQERMFNWLSQQLAKTTNPNRLLSQSNTWIHPIYQNQSRIHQQLETIVSNTAALNQTVNVLKRQVASIKEIARAEPAIRPQPTFVRHQKAAYEQAQSLEAEHLRRQLEVLEQRIKEFQANPVQPAGHLEPVYNPQRQLQPMPTTYNR